MSEPGPSTSSALIQVSTTSETNAKKDLAQRIQDDSSDDEILASSVPINEPLIDLQSDNVPQSSLVEI